MARSLVTRNNIASAKMEGVDLDEDTIADLQAIEAGTKTADEVVAAILAEYRLPAPR